MIADIDKALREILLKEMPLRKGEVDITFDQPKREWSARLSKPTLNLYLYDVRENLELRGSEQMMRQELDENRVALRRTPTRIDLCYMVSGWAKEAQDEHRLLSAALIAFLRQPFMPADLVPVEVKSSEFPVRITVAQGPSAHEKISDLWNTLDNELRPGLRLTVTIAIEPHSPEIASQVRTTEFGFRQRPSPDAIASAQPGAEPTSTPANAYFMVNGIVTSKKYSPAILKMILKERGKEIEIEEDGKFRITRLRAGEYHLDVLANDRLLKHQKIQVPSPKYEVEV